MASIRRHNKGFMADVRIRGQRRRKVFRTRRDAEKAISRWEAEGLQPKASGDEASKRPDRAGPTMGNVFDGWIDHKEAMTSKPGSLRNARDSVRRLSRHFRRGQPAESLTGRDIDRFVAKCRGKSWRPASINHDLRALKSALRWAADPDRGALLPKVPLRVNLVPEPKINGATVRRLLIDETEFQRLLRVSSPKLRALFALCAYAGLRRDEALHLQLNDVDLLRGIVSVREKPEVNWSPKTHQERDVEIGPKLRRELETYLATLKPQAIRRGDSWLFTSQRNRGERLKEVGPQVRRAYSRAKIEVTRGGCHTLRKKWATEAAEAGDYEALREMGGWSTWAAMAHYVSAGKERRRKIADRF